jgi:hypothetical protein
LRGRYDVARCADESVRGGIELAILEMDEGLKNHAAKMKPEEIVPLAKKILQLDSSTPYDYDYRWINLYGMGAFTGNTHELSLPEKQWPGLLKKNRDDFLKSAEDTAVGLGAPRKQ